jgi:hypothetical protein
MRPAMAYLKEESLAIELRMEDRLGKARYGIPGVLVCGALLEVKQNGPCQAAGFVGDKESDCWKPIHLASPNAVYPGIGGCRGCLGDC